jgi:cell fate (sporulation/competence/biofilm development) regulator YlbF (YheA/YmcA/DUF963 family)
MGKPTPQSLRDLLKPWLVGRVNDDGEQRGYCPICEDVDTSKSPSASYNFQDSVFTCFSQCGGMSIRSLVSVMRQSGDFRKEKPSSKSKSEATNTTKLPREELLEGYVDALLASRQHLRVMREKRGLTRETIEEFQLGWDGERFTIPVRDADGNLLNVRRYNPSARQAKDKMKSWAVGTGSRQLFGADILAKSETVIITEGEMDCIIGRQHGLPTISHTAGAGAWDERWNERFEGKIVYVCYDCDDAGRRGARRVARSLEMFAKQVHIIALPLKGNGDDLTNYFVDQGYTASDFFTLMKQSSENANRTSHLSGLRSQPAQAVGLEATMNAEIMERPITFNATVAGKVQPAYVGPKRVEYNCGEGGGTRCARCPISGRNHLEIDIPEHDPVVLESLNKNSAARRKVLLGHVKIPPSCPDVEVEETQRYSVEEMILIPPADEAFGQVTNLSRRLFNVGKYRTPTNVKVSFTGMNTIDTDTGRSVLQAWQSEEASANIDQFTMTSETYKELTAFWPSEDQSCIDKMKEIAADLEANVTKIYHRPALHIAYDLVWHSALDFQLKGQDVGKGWLELLVIGDTRTGKSEAAKRLCQHYRAGVLTTCEGATFAGLVGGVQQISGNWIISWGVIPLNDRRLVVLDEFGGLAGKGILEQMSSVRSSGIAQVNKIVSSETQARTRLIYVANPVEGVTINSYTNGAMDAVKGLANNPEDIARFDFALAVASQDVSADEINSRRPPRVRHRYTAHLCSQLINWVWSRKADQIVWGSGVENYVLERAQEMGRRYVPDPPLVQAENVRIKLARLAVAVAGRLFSTDQTGELLVVDYEHVEAAERLLNAFYGMDSFGYKEHSATVIHERKVAAQNEKSVRQYLAANEDALETLKQCIGGPFKMRDFQEFGGMSQIEAQEVVRQLQQWRVIRRLSKGYIRAEETLTKVVKELDRQ